MDPSKYGIENGGYEYARYGDLIIKRPADKSEHDNPEKVLVVVDGQTMTADEYIANKAKPDLDGKIP